MKDFIKQRIREGLSHEVRLKFDMDIPEDIRHIQAIFHKNNHKLYLVGGAVRDALLGKKIKDYDLATDAVPDKVETMMQQAGLRTVATGKAFGVINVYTETSEYEVATFRIDQSGGRRPDSVSFTDIAGDVKRRDLTINALFYDTDTNEIIDLVGGIEDLKKGIIRTVGAAEDRFGEDKLRILRAVRFAGRFGSNLDPSVDAALMKDASLEGISGERIKDEFLKGITSTKSVKHFLQMIDKYNLFDWVFRGLKVDKDFVEVKDPIVVIATLLKSNVSTILPRTLNGLKYKDDELRPIKFLVDLLKLSTETAVQLKRAQTIAKVTDEQIKSFAIRQGIDSNLLETFLRFKLTVSGAEVKEKFGLNDGPELGRMIHKIEMENFAKMLR